MLILGIVIDFEHPLTNNDGLRNATELYETAVVSYSTLVSDGFGE